MRSPEGGDLVSARAAPGAVLRGHAVSPGYGEGTAYVYHSRVALLPARRDLVPAEVAHEKARLDAALVASVAELEQLRERILSEIGEAESEIIASHRALISDPSFVAKLDAHIEVQLVNAEFAVHVECDALAEPLQARGQSVPARASGGRPRSEATPAQTPGVRSVGDAQHLPPRTVLVARELLPSDTLNLIAATSWGWRSSTGAHQPRRHPGACHGHPGGGQRA